MAKRVKPLCSIADICKTAFLSQIKIENGPTDLYNCGAFQQFFFRPRLRQLPTLFSLRIMQNNWLSLVQENHSIFLIITTETLH